MGEATDLAHHFALGWRGVRLYGLGSLGTAVTDSATLSGADASTATGTVTYNVYSNSACTVVASGGTPETITTAGHGRHPLR